MSYYGGGEISSDFVGLARARRQQDDPQVHQIYVSGCGGDVTAGKYNDGSPESRRALTERMYQAMVQAWEATRRQALEQVDCRRVAMLLPHRDAPGLTAEDLRRTLADKAKPFQARMTAALGLSSRERNAAGHAIDVQVIDLGPAKILLLPAESFVAYQLMAQQMLPDSFVVTVGYGECAPGYIPTEQAMREGFVEEHGYCWVQSGAEKIMAEAMRAALTGAVK
jgi:hypothetical protein